MTSSGFFWGPNKMLGTSAHWQFEGFHGDDGMMVWEKKKLVVRKTCGLLSGLDDFDFSQPLLFWSLPRYVMMPVNVADRGWDDERCGACLQ